MRKPTTQLFSGSVGVLCDQKVVTWDDATGSMVPFGSNRTYAREETEGGGTGKSSVRPTEINARRRGVEGRVSLPDRKEAEKGGSDGSSVRPTQTIRSGGDGCISLPARKEAEKEGPGIIPL